LQAKEELIIKCYCHFLKYLSLMPDKTYWIFKFNVVMKTLLATVV